MDKKYIDAERALFVVKGLRGPTRSPAQNEMIQRAINGIERLPAADVAPVVRCRDCAHCYATTFCRHWGGRVRPDHYCGDGVLQTNCGAKMDRK